MEEDKPNTQLSFRIQYRTQLRRSISTYEGAIFKATLFEWEKKVLSQQKKLCQQDAENNFSFFQLERFFAFKYKFASNQQVLLTLEDGGETLQKKIQIGDLVTKKNLSIRTYFNEGDKPTGVQIIVKMTQKVSWYEKILKIDWKGADIRRNNNKKCNSYLKFLRINEDETFIQISRTQIIENSDSPNWKKKSIQLVELINPETHLPAFQVQCWHHDKISEQDEFIGEARIELQTLKASHKEPLILVLEKRISRSSDKNMGKLILNDLQFTAKNTGIRLLNYIGLYLNVGVNLKNKNAQGQNIHIIETILEKIWTIIKTYSRKKNNHFYGFNIGAIFHHSNLEGEYIDPRLSNNLPDFEDEDQKSEDIIEEEMSSAHIEGEKKQKIYRQIFEENDKTMLFGQSKEYSSAEDYTRQMKKYYEEQQEPPNYSELSPFILQIQSMIPKDDIKFYRLALIITDSPFNDMEYAVHKMIVESNPASFFVLQINPSQDMKGYKFLNQDIVQHEKGFQSSLRPLARFMEFDYKFDQINEFIQVFLAPLERHIITYIDYLEQHSSEQDSKFIEQEIPEVRRSDSSTFEFFKTESTDFFWK